MLLRKYAITWTQKRRVLMNAFITSQFSYCPLVWMFHSRTLNNRINKIHERALRLVYKNETFLSFLSFDDLLKRNKSVGFHQKNLGILATENRHERVKFTWWNNKSITMKITASPSMIKPILRLFFFFFLLLSWTVQY